MAWIRIATAAGAIAAALAAAPPTLAATASTGNPGARYVAAPGELNQVVIESVVPPLVFPTVVFIDSVPIIPVSPCVSTGARAAECPLPQGSQPPLVVELGDQGDQALVRGQPTYVSRVVAGPGNDSFEMAPTTTRPSEFLGEDGNDRGIGGRSGDYLSGGGGNDSLFGGEGGDRLRGGPGNDRMYGGNGRDRIDGQDGDDSIRVRDSESNVSDIVSCGGGSDLVVADARDRVRDDCERVRRS